MSRCEFLAVIILFLMIAPAMGKEVAYAYGEFEGRILDSGNIIEFNGSDLINFTVAGGSDGESQKYESSRDMDSIESEIMLKINKFNKPVRDESRNLIGTISGPRRIDQICSIYDQLVNNWSYVEDWKGLDEFQYSNYTLERGKTIGSKGQGDCDDFSILLASLAESVGATSRIIFAYGPNEGHAYAEVYLGNMNDSGSDVPRMIKWLKKKYHAEEINTHADLDSGDVWLNLDWWRDPGGANHPGGPFFSATKQTQVYPRGPEGKAPLTALNEPPKILKFAPEDLGLRPRTAGSIITFAANVSNPENDSTYFMFRINNENVTKWISTSGPLTKNDSHLTWETNSSHIGSNTIDVWIRDGKHANEIGFDDKGEIRLEIKPAVPETIWSAAPSASSFSWGSQDFAGFYYDINEDVGNEKLAVNITNEATLSGNPPYGLVYTTKAQNKKFKFREWGDYKVIGFLGKAYFAGYNSGRSKPLNFFYGESQDNDSLACEQLEEILIDNNNAMTITSGAPLRLREGYELAIKSIDINGNKAYLELSKDGQVVDSRVIIPPKFSDDGSYCYSKDIGSENVKIIEVHLKKAFQGAEQNLVALDSIWQASENDPSNILNNKSQEMVFTTGTPLKLEEGYELAIKSININANAAYLELSKDGQMVDSSIIIPPNTAYNSSFYYSKDSESENAKIIEVHFKNAFRGADQNLATVDRIWQASENYPRNILNNKSQEMLLTSATPLRLEEGYELAIKSIDIGGNRVYLELSKDGQVVDSSEIIPPKTADDESFYYSKDSGSDNAKIIEVHFKNAFRGVDRNLVTVDSIWQASENDPRNILNNDSQEMVLTSGTPLRLKEGYELAIKSVDIDGNKVYLELSKDSQVVDSSIIIPPNIVEDGSFCYSKDFGSEKAKIIDVHLKNAFRGAYQNLVTVDRIWQASENDPRDILNNDSQEMVFTTETSLRLEEGYELAIKSIDIDGNKVYLELIKDGQVVDSSIIIPPNNVEDGSFYYSKDFGSENAKIIDVHFKSAFRGADQNLVTVDSVWQASENDPSNILNNDSQEMVFTTETSLRLEEGYELAINSVDIDGNRVYLELTRDGFSVCSKIVTPSVNGQNKLKSAENYRFKMSLGSQKDLVIMGVHFKNIFRGADQNLATIDGVWQISDNPITVSPETEYDRMTISEVDAANGTIVMNNIENPIFLTENSDYSLMPEFRLKTADENKFKENGHINFALFKEISLAGVYNIRSHIATDNSSWFSSNFSGFFYDIDKSFGTETIHINLSNGNQLSGEPPYGVAYTTTSQEKNFRFKRWGTYGEIGFLGKKYFNNYLKSPDASDDDEILLAESTDRNSLAKGQLEEILKDDRNDIVLESGKTLKLAEGYELVIESIDSDGMVSLELNKDGSLKDLMKIAPSKDGANMADKTYYYVTDVGKLKGLAIIAVHFKKAIRVGGNSQAIVDGIWQISDKPYNVELGTQYDRMRIATIDPYRGIITMDNRDNTITLTRNKDISLMEGICLKTADNDTLRYHIYKPVTIGEDAMLSENIL